MCLWLFLTRHSYNWCISFISFFFSSRMRHTRCALVTGVQTCALPISAAIAFRLRVIDRDFGAVVHRHPNHLTHGYQSLSRLPRACRRAVLPSPFWRKDCPSTSSEPAPAKARGERGREGGVNHPSPPCIAAKSLLRAPRLCSGGIFGGQENPRSHPPRDRREGLSRVENSGGIQGNITAGLAGRYAVALFDLARESNAIDGVQKSLAALRQGLTDSADPKALTQSPVISRADAPKAVAAAGIGRAHARTPVPNAHNVRRFLRE